MDSIIRDIKNKIFSIGNQVIIIFSFYRAIVIFINVSFSDGGRVVRPLPIVFDGIEDIDGVGFVGAGAVAGAEEYEIACTVFGADFGVGASGFASGISKGDRKVFVGYCWCVPYFFPGRA